MQVPAAIQIASTVSDGKLTCSDIISIARQNGIKVVVITDRDHMLWEYGLWPLRNVIKKTVAAGSIVAYGISRYLREAEMLRRDNPDVVLLGGIESAPFYYWKGNPFTGDLAIVDWHKHLISIGLDSYQDIANLPVVGNKKGLARRLSGGDIVLWWPVLLLAAGIGFLGKRQYDYTDSSGKRLGPYALRWRVAGVVLVAAGMLFLWNNFPFRTETFDQYHGAQGVRPYQQFIDYVTGRGGMVFWAHPEAANTDRQGAVAISTEEYSTYIFQTVRYTGFAIFYEGYNTVGRPGGLWDTVLSQYCHGKRSTPVWAIGGLAFDTQADLGGTLKDLRTVLLVRSLDKAACLDALKNGRMYVVRGQEAARFVLRDVSIRDSEGELKATMGEQVTISGVPEFRIQGDLSGLQKPFTIKLVRDTSVIRTFEVASPFDITFRDEESVPHERSYYRAEISSSGIMAVTNPIFVQRVRR